MYALLLASSLFTIGCRTPIAQKAEPSVKVSPADLFPAPRQGLSIKAGAEGDTSLSALLDEFSRVTGHPLLVSKRTEQVLMSTPTGLNRSVEVPAEDVYFFVETILVTNGVMLTLHGGRPPRLLGVRSVDDSGGYPRSPSVVVSAEEVTTWARHPAFLVTTVVDLPSTDVRTLANSMRTMFTDANTQSIIPVGNSNSLILTGFAPQVAEIVAMLRVVDEMSRASPRPVEKVPAPQPQPPKEPAAK